MVASHTGPRGRKAEAPQLGLAPTSVLFHLGHREPLPPHVSPSLQQAPHPRMASAPAANHSLDKRGLPASRKGLGRVGWDGMGRWPILPLLQEQRDKGAGTERPAAHPAALLTAASHTGFTGLPSRRDVPQAINYKSVQGGKGWGRRLRPQVETAALSRRGPEQAPGWERSPALTLGHRGMSGGRQPRWASFSPSVNQRAGLDRI